MKITSQTLAELCGVSRGTVYRALNNKGDVNPATRQKILELAAQLGYKPDYLASSLRKGHTKTIGLVAFDLYNEYFAHLINDIESFARESGYFIYITLTDKKADYELDIIRDLLSRNVDGLILLPINRSDAIASLDIRIPLVTIGNRLSADCPFIGINDFQAEYSAVEFAVSKHYQRFLFISTALKYQNTSNISAQQERCDGFLAAMEAHAISAKDHAVLQSIEPLDSILGFIAASPLRTAILCSSDITALDLLFLLKKTRLRIPEDVGIMGFDNIQMLTLIEPKLTTVHYPIKRTAKKAVEYLIALMEGREPAYEEIPYEIIERETI